MSKFVMVKEAPATLRKGETVINAPDFLEQIQKFSKRAPRNGLTQLNHLKDILTAVQDKYEVDLNLVKIPLSARYLGLPFKSDSDLSRIVTNLLKEHRPELFEKVLEYNIKNRPYGTKLVYYVGDLGDTTPFFRNGVDMIEEKDVDEYLGLKAKKIVGKPAVTKEQSEESAG